MSEQTLNVNVTVQKDKKKNIRKAGKTLLIKPNEGVEIDESWFNDLVGLVSKSKTAKTGSYFLTFDNVGNSLDSLKTLRKKAQREFPRVMKIIGQPTEKLESYHLLKFLCFSSKFIEDNTDSKVLYYKLYRNKSYLGCGDVTIDTKSGLDSLLDKEKFKEFDLSDNTGVFYRYNSKKSNMDEKEEGDAVEADV